MWQDTNTNNFPGFPIAKHRVGPRKDGHSKSLTIQKVHMINRITQTGKQVSQSS